MKNFKKLTAAVAATLMAATMVAPMAMNLSASAADSISLDMSVPVLPANASIVSNEVKAYKIFEMGAGGNVASVNGWGDAVDASVLITALKADETLVDISEGETETVSDFKDVTYNEDDTAASAKAVAEIISAYDNTKAEAFARLVVNNLNENAKVSIGKYSKNEVTLKETVTFETGLDDGYYVMMCEVAGDSTGTPNKNTSKSLGMLTVINGVAQTTLGTGEAKVGLPTVEKKVKENVKSVAGKPVNDSETTEKWNDVADYDINDTVPFKLYGTMPSNLDNYEAYYYEFVDTLGSEFTITDSTTVTVKIDGKDIEFGKNVRVTKDTDNNKINVSFENIKAYDVTTSSIVTVEYDAVLNDTAKVGLPGQQNAVSLKYSNNPNLNYNPNTNDDEEDKPDNPGETPEDKVIVFTYGMNFEKTFVTSDGTPVSDDEISNEVFEEAEFHLETADGKIIYVKSNPSASTDGFKYIVVESLDNTDTKYNDSNDVFSKLTLDKKTTGEGDSSKTEYVLSVKGLDDGTYKIVEDKAPSGFNKATPQEFKIIATTSNNQLWKDFNPESALTKFEYQVDDGTPVSVTELTNASAQLTMQNKQGTSLPSTGGIGTTLFYLGGGAMVAVAGVFLITKKRMKKEEV